MGSCKGARVIGISKIGGLTYRTVMALTFTVMKIYKELEAEAYERA